MTDQTTTVSRRRRVTFWFLMVLLLVLHLGERPEQLGFVFTAFAGYPEGAGATHEIHMFAQGVFAWAILLAVAVQLRRTATQIGAAWVYGLGSVLAFTMFLALADLPGEAVPVIAAAIVIGALAFVAHPSPWRAKFTPVAPPSRTLLALTAVAAVPLVIYAIGQLNIHTGSGPHDEHFAFGHWIAMAIYALLIPVFAAVAAMKVSGWRFPLITAGAMTAALGIASLGISAVSQLTTVWALLAIAWGVVFVVVGTKEAKSDAPAPGPAPAPQQRANG